MAKKKKYENIKLEQNELQPIAIGEYGLKKKSSIGIVVILAIFIIAIFFLPEISSYVTKFINNYFNPTSTTTNPSNPNTPEEPTPSEENYADTFYAFDSTLSIKRDDITVSDFAINPENNTLTYEITNNTDSYQNIEDLNYYIEIYNSNKVFLERVKLAHDLALNSGSFRSVTSNISSISTSSIGQIVLLKKQTSDYPIVDLATNEEGYQVLVCTRPNEVATYQFTDNLLKEMTHEYTYEATNEDYQEVYANYRASSNTYNSRSGVTSSFFDNVTNFSITTHVDLSVSTRTYIFNADTFKLDTESNIVKFEMESQNFTCN